MNFTFQTSCALAIYVITLVRATLIGCRYEAGSRVQLKALLFSILAGTVFVWSSCGDSVTVVGGEAALATAINETPYAMGLALFALLLGCAARVVAWKSMHPRRDKPVIDRSYELASLHRRIDIKV